MKTINSLDRLRSRAQARARGAYRTYDHVRPGMCFTQHDMVLDNQPGASFRSDANSALGALVTNSSGAAEPATKYAHMLWADTTANLLKMRNAANTAWVTLGTLGSSFMGLVSHSLAVAKGDLLAATGAGAFAVVSAGTNNFLLTADSAVAGGVKWAAPASIPTGVSLDFMGTPSLIPSGYLAEDGSNVSRVTFAALFAVLIKAANATISNASPGVVTWNAHGLANGDVVKFFTSGALPSPLVAGTTYFVVNGTTNTFNVAATEGGAAINTTTGGSGTHTAVHAPYGDGDGSTTFTLPDTRRRAMIGRGGTPTATVGARLGATGGAETHTLSEAESALKTHNHGVTDAGHAHEYIRTDETQTAQGGLSAESPPLGNSQVGGAITSVNATGISIQNNNGAASAHNNMQPVLVVTKIIKT